MCHLAGALVIHSVAEDAFWLLTGMMEAVLKEYYDASGPGIRVDAGVFDVVLRGSEKDLATTFRQVGIKCECGTESNVVVADVSQPPNSSTNGTNSCSFGVYPGPLRYV